MQQSTHDFISLRSVCQQTLYDEQIGLDFQISVLIYFQFRIGLKKWIQKIGKSRFLKETQRHTCSQSALSYRTVLTYLQPGRSIWDQELTHIPILHKCNIGCSALPSFCLYHPGLHPWFCLSMSRGMWIKAFCDRSWDSVREPYTQRQMYCGVNEVLT